MEYTDTKVNNRFLSLNALTKILLVILSIFVLTGERNTYSEIIWMVFLSIIGLSLRQTKMTLKFVLAYSLIYLLSISIGRYTNPILSFLAMLINLVRFFFPVMFVINIVVKSTDTGELLVSLQKVRVPLTLSVSLAVMFRFIPTAMDEFSAIQQASKYRNVKMGRFSIILNPFKFIKYIVLPMLTTSERLIDDLATSALTRGLNSEVKRTSYRKVIFTYFDIAIIVVAFALLFYLKGWVI